MKRRRTMQSIAYLKERKPCNHFIQPDPWQNRPRSLDDQYTKSLGYFHDGWVLRHREGFLIDLILTMAMDRICGRLIFGVREAGENSKTFVSRDIPSKLLSYKQPVYPGYEQRKQFQAREMGNKVTCHSLAIPCVFAIAPHLRHTPLNILLWH